MWSTTVAVPVRAVGQAEALHRRRRRSSSGSPANSGLQPVAVVLVEAVVGVEPEDPVAGGVPQALVAGGGEVVHPGEVEDLRAEASGDLAWCGRSSRCPRRRSRRPGRRAESRQSGRLCLLVLDDHAQRHARQPRLAEPAAGRLEHRGAGRAVSRHGGGRRPRRARRRRSTSVGGVVPGEPLEHVRRPARRGPAPRSGSATTCAGSRARASASGSASQG